MKPSAQINISFRQLATARHANFHRLIEMLMHNICVHLCRSVAKKLIIPFEFVIFDDRIGKQIAAEPVQSFFQIGTVTLQFNLHIFSDANAPHLGHSQMVHGITDCCSLRIKDSFFGFDYHIHFHPDNIDGLTPATSDIPILITAFITGNSLWHLAQTPFTNPKPTSNAQRPTFN